MACQISWSVQGILRFNLWLYSFAKRLVYEKAQCRMPNMIYSQRKTCGKGVAL